MYLDHLPNLTAHPEHCKDICCEFLSYRFWSGLTQADGDAILILNTTCEIQLDLLWYHLVPTLGDRMYPVGKAHFDGSVSSSRKMVWTQGQSCPRHSRSGGLGRTHHFLTLILRVILPPSLSLLKCHVIFFPDLFHDKFPCKCVFMLFTVPHLRYCLMLHLTPGSGGNPARPCWHSHAEGVPAVYTHFQQVFMYMQSKLSQA